MSVSERTPKYRRQTKASGDLAFVELNGRRHYLGRYADPKGRERYHRLIAEWTANGRRVRVTAPDLSVAELCAAFMRHAETFYRKPDGTLTGTSWNYRAATKVLDRLYGTMDVAAFTPQGLKAVREAMIRADWCRKSVNQGVNLIRSVFRWGVSEGMAPVAVHTGLTTVTALRRGRSDAREGRTIQPVPDATVDATLRYMTPTVTTMVQFQRLTGARPSEVCMMRSCDVNTEGRIWEYRPSSHKTEHHERERVVFIGPKAQAVLKPFLSRDLQAFVFSPQASEAERHERMHAERVTPLSCGNTPGTNRVRRPKRTPGERFNTSSYRQAIEYACDRAFPAPGDLDGNAVKQWRGEHRWAPNRLRHSFATNVRREHGLEAAQVMLGHASANIPQIYAKRDSVLAAAVALRIG